jgi:hypothetical protein
MTRNYLLIGILALNVTTPVVAGIQCSISDWPLEMPHGTSDFIRVFAPGLTANTVVTHLHTSTRTVGSHPSPANAASTLAPRNWKDRRSPTPSQWQKLFYAVMDDDGAQVERLLGSTRVDLNVSPSSNGRGSLLNVAAALGEPEVARVLIAHGAHVRDQPGDSIQLHPIADAVGGLEGYLNTRDLPDPFFNRPPRSTERYLAAIHMLLDAGADPDALVVPSETLSPLGNLMFVPRFAGDVEIVRLLVAHGASVDGPPPIRSPLGIALDKGYDDYAAALLADHHVSAATLNHGLIMAIAREDVAMGQTLLGSGADANFKIGTVPVLCRALDSREMHSLALALLAHQADANVDCGDPRSRGGTPLTLVDPDDHELIDLLVARGGELGVPAVDGTLYRSQGVDPGPINWALLHHRDHVAFALLAREPSAAHECGTLVYAARYGATETLARLLALGGDPNSSSADGVSALMAAALGGSVDATSLLIAHGARLHKKDAEGLEAAEYAHNDAVAQLLAGGANATN